MSFLITAFYRLPATLALALLCTALTAPATLAGPSEAEQAAAVLFDLPPDQKYRAALKILRRGEVTPDDRDVAIKLATQSATAGFADAQYSLGLWFEHGKHGLAPDPAAARTWLRKAAEQGHMFAQSSLADNLAREGSADAETWYRKAAEQGFPDAQYKLARLILSNAEALPQARDVQDWLTRAHDMGHEDAAIGLAHYHAFASRNPGAAIATLQSAASDGSCKAIHWLIAAHSDTQIARDWLLPDAARQAHWTQEFETRCAGETSTTEMQKMLEAALADYQF